MEDRRTIATLWRPGNLMLFLQVLGLVVGMPLLLRVLPFRRLLVFLTPDKPRSLSREKAELAIQYTDILLGLNLPGCGRNCLRRTLVLYHFLRRAGLGVRVNLGVKYEPGKRLSGHGWLTVDGKTYLEQGEPERSFQLIYSYP